MNISFDLSLLFEENIGKNGLTKLSLNDIKLNKNFEKVQKNLDNKAYGFINILTDESITRKCEEVFEQVAWAKQLVVLGIGGSDLGGRMLQQALQADNPPMEVYFAGDTTDPQ
ncbi:hypothetical protein GYA49_04155, partial [Candidatus Beckwithbacteria bacterium]|nr:hypothetical protein [Candidatus Beckwithbacteria bacterium]